MREVTLPYLRAIRPAAQAGPVAGQGELASIGFTSRHLPRTTRRSPRFAGICRNDRHFGWAIHRCPARCLLVAAFAVAQFTPGSRTTLRTRPPLTPSDREYTPARSADKHLPEAHCRRLSILSPAVTATGTINRNRGAAAKQARIMIGRRMAPKRSGSPKACSLEHNPCHALLTRARRAVAGRLAACGENGPRLGTSRSPVWVRMGW